MSRVPALYGFGERLIFVKILNISIRKWELLANRKKL